MDMVRARVDSYLVCCLVHGRYNITSILMLNVMHHYCLVSYQRNLYNRNSITLQIVDGVMIRKRHLYYNLDKSPSCEDILKHESGLSLGTYKRCLFPIKTPLTMYTVLEFQSCQYRILIRVTLNFNPAGTSSTMTHIMVLSAKVRWNEWLK